VTEMPGWLVLGGVVAGTVGLGAWLASRGEPSASSATSVKFGALRMMRDGLLVWCSREEGKELVQKLRAVGYKFGLGEAGRGLYSRTWDRQMGEFVGDRFYANPSILYDVDINPYSLELEDPRER